MTKVEINLHMCEIPRKKKWGNLGKLCGETARRMVVCLEESWMESGPDEDG